ncbi:P1 family peptidase [Pseudoflavonifractor phocaeensis]|uniref:P1 family peptidase n=1 Tax=Pseudoflavonifractor phocaeensis TaxID=1870988 RepID=UPI001F3F8D17|nr:P1 family peptidase [Pseudoflavonifractor phocaeensis]MCF2660547.1 P1 family peptidase [Pseudoflavonifractor phocaeensis]
MNEIGIMEVGGFRVGHAQNVEAATGCTVILCDRMSPAGLDVRGGGPASRESQILNPVANAEGINAVLLSGGSAFGLDSAGGVQKYLEERDIGFDVGVTKVPLVSQSCLFDLSVGSKDIRPDAAMAYAACENASAAAPAEGNVGAGTGCSVGKYRGIDRAMKSGFGTYALQAGALKVGALVAVNALGDIYGPDGRQVAGLLDPERTGLASTLDELFRDVTLAENLFTGNTTLGVIVTNARFQKTQLTKIAGMTHNGYARAIRPVHTTADGDSIYALSVGQVPGDLNVVGAMAALAMERAILRAVQSARSAYGLPGWEAIHGD